jgi:hypothetical protein
MGIDGKTFQMFKFRTMYTGAEPAGAKRKKKHPKPLMPRVDDCREPGMPRSRYRVAERRATGVLTTTMAPTWQAG